MASDDSAHQRRTVHYSGRVQGVGFRYTVRELARSYPVTGTVENLPDGQVKLVAEGPGTALDGFLSAIAEQRRAYIRNTQCEITAARGEFTGFEIRR